MKTVQFTILMWIEI